MPLIPVPEGRGRHLEVRLVLVPGRVETETEEIDPRLREEFEKYLKEIPPELHDPLRRQFEEDPYAAVKRAKELADEIDFARTGSWSRSLTRSVWEFADKATRALGLPTEIRDFAASTTGALIGPFLNLVEGFYRDPIRTITSALRGTGQLARQMAEILTDPTRGQLSGVAIEELASEILSLIHI